MTLVGSSKGGMPVLGARAIAKLAVGRSFHVQRAIAKADECGRRLPLTGGQRTY